ncbi:hypothetical protein Tco_0415529 [Tanacetum coccineum]
MAGYDLSEAYVLKKLHKEKIKEPEKERGEKCITNDDEYKNASPRKCLCWKVKKDRAIFNAQSMKPTEDLVTWELKKDGCVTPPKWVAAKYGSESVTS